MKLLILTQKIDKEDNVLGFFHRWVEEFARHCERITVICLEKGDYDLPSNVKVFSLEKERGKSRVKYIFRFYTHIFRERKNYDAVFVHMNQEYVLLGYPAWRLMGKKILLWRNHRTGNFFTRIAIALSDKVFCTSKFSFTAKYEKTKIVGVGIDVNLFKRDENIKREDNSLLFLGRVSPIKKHDVLLEALKILRDKKIFFHADIIGDAVSQSDENYLKKLKDTVLESGLSECVRFSAGLPHGKIPEVYNKHDIVINLTPSGSLDKTILESFACENICIISNESLRGEIPDVFFVEQDNAAMLAEKIHAFLVLSAEKKKELGVVLRRYAKEKHSINSLVPSILS